MAETVLDKIKNALGVTGTYQDATLQVYIDEVIAYMIDAGVPEDILKSKISAGVIARGATDLWNYNGGAGKLSEYFYQRVSQLIYGCKTGKIISFNAGDYGQSYPINIEGIEIKPEDTITFKCDSLTKEYTEISDNCILVTFTEEESASLEAGTYNWTLKITKDSAVITAVKDGVLIVT